MNSVEAKFKLRGIILVQSNFMRTPDVVINQGEKTETNVEVKSDTKDEKKIATELIVNLVSKFKEKVQFEANIVMVGLFEAENVKQEEIDSFSRINAPAIIFPFMREHIISLTTKAGLPPVALPLINFVQHAKNTEETEKVKV